MIKLIILLLLFISVSYVGIAIGINYHKKEKFYRELIMFCNLLSNNIKFNKNKLNQIIEQNISNFKTELKDYLINFINDKKYKVLYLDDFENNRLNEFFLSIGKMDSDGELNNIENYKHLFTEYYNSSKESNSKYGTMSSKLGVILGLILVIIFI